MSSLGQANPVELPNNVFPDPGYRDPRGNPQTPRTSSGMCLTELRLLETALTACLACSHPHPTPHIGFIIHDYVTSFLPVSIWLRSPAHGEDHHDGLYCLST